MGGSKDENGVVLWVICGPLGEGDSTKAEALRLLYGLHEIKALVKFGCLVEGDSKVVISWALGLGEGSWIMRRYILKVRVIMREMGIVLNHIPRTQNGEADRLAKWGRDQSEGFKGDNFPEWDRLV